MEGKVPGIGSARELIHYPNELHLATDIISSDRNKKAGFSPAFLLACNLASMDEVFLALCDFGLLPRGKRQLFPSLFREGVTILILQHAIQIQIGDAFTNSCLAYAQVCVRFDALPKVSFQNCEANVGLLLLFVCVDDV